MKTKKSFLSLLVLLTFVVFSATAQTTDNQTTGKGKKFCCVKSCSKKSTASVNGDNSANTAQQNLENCPLKGTPDCPLLKNCPHKGTANCPYAKNASVDNTEATASVQNIANCPLKGTPDCPLLKNCPHKGTPNCPLVK